MKVANPSTTRFPLARCERDNKKGKTTMKYIRSHIVEAKPATLGEWEAETGKKWNEADRPRTDEGYKCDYPDGYSGWCPKAEFEKVSSPIENMTFGQAIDACRYRGKKVQRVNWNGEGQYVRFEKTKAFTEGGMTDHPEGVVESKCFVFHFVNRKTGETGIQVGWLASQADMAADDWKIVE